MMEVYWIVNDFDRTFSVFRNTIKELWGLDDKNISNVKSIIAVSDETKEKAEDAIQELYSRTCFGIDGPNEKRPAFWKYHNLIENAVVRFTKNNDMEKTLEQKEENGGYVFHISADISEKIFYEKAMKIIRMHEKQTTKTIAFIVSLMKP